MKSLFAGLAIVAALFGAPAQAATTTFNFVSDCADCSVTHGPGTQASATLVIDDMQWEVIDGYTYNGNAVYQAGGIASDFSYHSDWLGTITGGENPVNYSLITSDPANYSTGQYSFQILFVYPLAGTTDGAFSFTGAVTDGDVGDWNVFYGTLSVQDYGTLLPGAWTVAAVPEPETYAMLLAGLGVLAAAAKRRKSKAA